MNQSKDGMNLQSASQVSSNLFSTIYLFKTYFIILVDKVDIEQVSFPSVSVCRPLSWTWPGIITYLSQNDKDGSLARQAIGEGNINWLGHFFKMNKHKCENLLEEFTSVSSEMLDKFDDDDAKEALLFYQYEIAQFKPNWCFVANGDLPQ